MSFLEEIEKEAVSREEAILKRAEETRSHLLEEARKEADRLKKTVAHRTDLEIKKERSRALTQSELKHRQALLFLKSAFVKKALDGARKAFDALPPREYEAVLKKFLSELAQNLEKENRWTLRVRPQDEKLAQAFLKELRLAAEIRTDASLSRGVELEGGEGAFRIRNTFDSRLREARGDILQRLNTLLFEGL